MNSENILSMISKVILNFERQVGTGEPAKYLLAQKQSFANT